MQDATDRPSYEPEAAEPSTPSTGQKYSAMQRLWMMFTSPGDVFSDIGVKPTWVLIMATLVVLGVAYQAIVIPHVDIEQTIRARFSEQDREVSEAQVETAVKATEIIARLSATVIPIVGLIIAALFFFLMLKMVGSGTDFAQTLSTSLHGYWPPTLVKLVLTAILVQRIDKVQPGQLERVVKADLGAFLSLDVPAWLLAAASTISVFNIWAVVLLIIGFTTVGKLSRAKATAVVLVPWAAWVVLKAALTAVFS
jgi:large-conductance mechanosensitive channel